MGLLTARDSISDETWESRFNLGEIFLNPSFREEVRGTEANAHSVGCRFQPVRPVQRNADWQSAGWWVGNPPLASGDFEDRLEACHMGSGAALLAALEVTAKRPVRAGPIHFKSGRHDLDRFNH